MTTLQSWMCKFARRSVGIYSCFLSSLEGISCKILLSYDQNHTSSSAVTCFNAVYSRGEGAQNPLSCIALIQPSAVVHSPNIAPFHETLTPLVECRMHPHGELLRSSCCRNKVRVLTSGMRPATPHLRGGT